MNFRFRTQSEYLWDHPGMPPMCQKPPGPRLIVHQSPFCSSSEPLIAIVKSADLPERDNPTLVGWLYEARFRAILFEREVGPGAVVILQVG
jgi:hypothetical protein